MKILWFLMPAVMLVSCGGAGDSDRQLKVVSYNIRLSTADDGENSWNLRKGATLEMLRREVPDIVGMQEVMADQYDFLAEGAGCYGIVGVGRDDGMRGGEMMAVMFRTDRFDKTDEGHFWLSETPDKVSRGWDGACNRMVTWLRLQDKVTGKVLYIFNTHLDHRGAVARAEGARLLARKIGEITGGEPFVLTGDFNAEAGDEVLAPLRSGFSDTRAKAPESDSKATYNGFGAAGAEEVIDHIYYHGLVPVSFRTLDGDYGAPFISDHYPVEAVFDFGGE